MAASTTAAVGASGQDCAPTFLQRLNTEWHERAMQFFLFIVLAHWAEHLAQAFQIYALGWAPPDARGVLGLWYPWLVKSERLFKAIDTGDAGQKRGLLRIE